ncbi:MAG TPA: nucleotide disphospho-sugar-binding domain-containing protein, partial [Mycobacteriales bacterium]|nr:nucleotide disphospho-sugar-binding domain-containing protein [Mycobacteriales bacterium]
MKVLVAVPPLAGHLNPATALAAELTRRGHEVAWVGSEAVLRPVLGPDAVVHPTGSRILREQSGHGAAAVSSLWRRFLVPYTKFTLPAVQRAVDAARPDLVLADQQMFAGALVAHRCGLPWATVATTTMELARPFRELPAVEAELAAHLDTVRAQAGVTGVDPRFSPYLCLALTSTVLSGPARAGRPAYVGPLLGRRPPVDFRRPETDRPLVLVSTGTLADDLATDFHRRVLAAAAGVHAILVAPPESVPDPPPHVTVAARVPVLELLPQLAAVVSHGGLNTVTEALAHGVPLVVAPIRHDQPVNARDVAAAGAGVRVSFARAEPARIAAALAAALGDPAYR